MKLAIRFIIILMLFPIIAQSQNQADNNPAPNIFKAISKSSDNQNRIVIKQDDQIKSLVERYTEAKRKENRIPGYRIRIFSNSGQTARSNMYGEKTRFLKSFPDVPTYIEYEAPNFKVYVGDFRTKIEAFRAYKQISKEFRNAFLVPAKINLPKL